MISPFSVQVQEVHVLQMSERMDIQVRILGAIDIVQDSMYELQP